MATTTISKSNLVEKIWRNFYDRVKDQVTSTTVANGTTFTIQHYSGANPDIDIDSKSDLPIIVVDTPIFSTELFTMTRTQLRGSIDIEVYATDSQAADQFLSQINNAVETFKGDLAGVGIHQIDTESTDADMVFRDSIKIHVRRITYVFVYRFDRTKSF